MRAARALTLYFAYPEVIYVADQMTNFKMCFSTMKRFEGRLRSAFLGVVVFALLNSGSVLAHMEESSQYPDLGKIKDLARDEIEFRLPSTKIRGFALSDFTDYKSVLLVGIDSQSCPSEEFLKELVRIQNQDGKKRELKIVVLDMAIGARREDITANLAKISKSASFTYLFDALQTVSRSFDLKKSGDYVLLDPRSLKISERGSLSPGVKLEETSKLGKEFRSSSFFSKISSKTSEPTQCGLKYETVRLDDFKEDFLRPFARACQSCHVATQVHDSFKTLDQVLGWRVMSLRTIRLMRMPGRYDPYYYKYRSPEEKYDAFHEPSLEDMRKIVAWLSNPPKVTDAMKKSFVESRESTISTLEKSASGYPVLLTLEMTKPVSVPAEGGSVYLNTFVGKPLEQDITVQGLYMRTNLSVVHHTTIFVFDPKKVDAKEFADSANMDYQYRQWTMRKKFYGSEALKKIDGSLNGKKSSFTQIFEPVIATFSRRQGAMLFPKDSAFTIKKGMQFAIQLHMEPSGKAEEATMSFDVLGRPFSEPFAPLKRISLNTDEKFKIAAGQDSYIAKSVAKFDKPTLVKTRSIHTHYRGIAARVLLRRPHGPEEIIASLPFMQMKSDRRLNFLRGGLALEAGSTLTTEIEYDNSERNPANPDPDAVVRLGGGTIGDEMYYPRYIYIER